MAGGPAAGGSTGDAGVSPLPWPDGAVPGARTSGVVTESCWWEETTGPEDPPAAEPA